MSKYQISINPFAEYLEATESRRAAILKEQLSPNKVKVFHYQLAKARIKKSIALSGSYKPVKDGIKILKERKPENSKKKSDQISSIEALERYMNMLLPDSIKDNKLELISVKQKDIDYEGISIKVSPDIIFRITIGNQKYIGGCKLHVSKRKPFSHKQSKLVAGLIDFYLSNVVVKEDEIVDSVLCFCLDPFAGTTINSNSKVALDMQLVKKLCSEIKQSLEVAEANSNVA